MVMHACSPRAKDGGGRITNLLIILVNEYSELTRQYSLKGALQSTSQHDYLEDEITRLIQHKPDSQP